MATPPLLSPLSNPSAAAIAVTLVIADILHECRRTRRAPIFRLHSGGAAPAQEAAIAFGWLQVVPDDPYHLELTRAGHQALADAARPKGVDRPLI